MPVTCFHAVLDVKSETFLCARAAIDIKNCVEDCAIIFMGETLKYYAEI